MTISAAISEYALQLILEWPRAQQPTTQSLTARKIRNCDRSKYFFSGNLLLSGSRTSGLSASADLALFTGVRKLRVLVLVIF